jgi:hypothetical protein
MAHREGDKIRVRDSVIVTCPFCAKEVTAGTTMDDECFVGHALPMCPDFHQMEPEDFLKRCNEMALN